MDNLDVVSRVMNQYIEDGHNVRDFQKEMSYVKGLRNLQDMDTREVPIERRLVFSSMSNSKMRGAFIRALSRRFQMREVDNLKLQEEINFGIEFVQKNSMNPELYEGFDNILETLEENRLLTNSNAYLLEQMQSDYQERISVLESQVLGIVMESGDEVDRLYKEGDQIDKMDDDLEKSLQEAVRITQGTKLIEETKIKSAMLEFALSNTSEENMLENAQILMNSLSRYDDIVMESQDFKKKLKELAFTAEKKTRKLASNVKNSSKETARVAKVGAKTVKHFTDIAKKLSEDVEGYLVEKRKETIIENNLRSKLITLLRYIIINYSVFAIVGGGAFGVATSLMATIVTMHIKNNTDQQITQELTNDLSIELKVTKEKIREADSKGDNKTKYQLMRLEDAIERDIKRLSSGGKGRAQINRHK